MQRKFTFFVLTVSVLAVCSAIPYHNQTEDARNFDAETSRALWNGLSSIRNAISTFTQRLFPCIGSSVGESTTSYYMRALGISGGTCAPSTASTTEAATTTTTKKPCDCGTTSRKQFRMFGSVYAASPEEFPWQVYLEIDVTSCTGALIHPQWIVTAASCLFHFEDQLIKVKAGFIERISTPLQTTTGKAFVHPSYSEKLGSLAQSDIGLVKLDTPFTITPSVYPICLPINEAANSFANYQINMAGWGRNTANNYTLTMAKMPVLPESDSTCPSTTFADKTMCLSISDTASPCTDDGGAPVTWYDSTTQKAKLIGINAKFVNNCGNNGPIRVTRVSSYLDWIQSTTGLTFCAS